MNKRYSIGELIRDCCSKRIADSVSSQLSNRASKVNLQEASLSEFNKFLLEGLNPKERIKKETIYPEHDWEKNEDGSINEDYSSWGYHQGPFCKRCYYSFCVLCNPDGYTTEECRVTEYFCPVCGEKVNSSQEVCSFCGQHLKG